MMEKKQSWKTMVVHRFSGKLIGAKLSLNNRCVLCTVMEIENIAQGLNTDENLIRDYIFCVRSTMFYMYFKLLLQALFWCTSFLSKGKCSPFLEITPML